MKTESGTNGTCDSTAFTLRTAVEDDLPHMSALSAASGQAIVPGGGDFVTMAWSGWWKQHPEMHYNQWVFNGDVGIAFARIEVYGTPEEVESGWLEGLRVHSAYQGKGIMKMVVDPLLQMVPTIVQENMYLAVGSGNALMCPIADKKYKYIGAQVAFGCKPGGGAPDLPLTLQDVKTSTRQISLSEADAVWTFMCTHTLYKNSRLLMPARFYGFRACTRAALEEKILAGRVYATFDGDSTAPGGKDSSRCLGVFFTFDTDLDMGGVMRWYTCCVADGLSLQQVTSVLQGWTALLPSADEAGSAITANVLSVGPALNVEGKPDVDPVMQEALDAVGFCRNLATHLRLYRMK